MFKKKLDSTKYEFQTVRIQQADTESRVVYRVIEEPRFRPELLPEHYLELELLLGFFGAEGWQLKSLNRENLQDKPQSIYVATFQRAIREKRKISWIYDIWPVCAAFLVMIWVVVAPLIIFEIIAAPEIISPDAMHDLPEALQILMLLPLVLFVFLIHAWWLVPMIIAKLIFWDWLLINKMYSPMYLNLRRHYLEKEGKNHRNGFTTYQEEFAFDQKVRRKTFWWLFAVVSCLIFLILVFADNYWSLQLFPSR